jgi:NAD+ diphosphatase
MNAIDTQPVFTLNPLDRMDHLRGDILANRDPATDKYLLLSKGSVLLGNTIDNNKPKDCFISPDELPEKLLSESLCVFLGGKEDHHYFTLDVTPEQAEQYEAIPLRTFVMEQMLPDDQLGILAEANSLLSWHHSYGFCARCGVKSKPAHGGWRRDCPSCEAEHFPRTDPVVIMLVTYGDKCLLGRGPNFAERRFSCLAGFMEPGETIAQAALRELWEEAGVKGKNVRYLFDQPWPFPSNLMIGVHIEAQDTDLTIDYNELEEVMWVSKADVQAVAAGDDDKAFLLPPSVAIARNLLDHWLND